MKKSTICSYWCLLCCLATQWSFCGKIQSVFLGNTDCLQDEGEQRSWGRQSREIKQPDTFFRRNRIDYNKKLFGPSVFEKKDIPKSGLKRSPPSDNLFRDSHESDTQSSMSSETSFSESSRAPTPESQRQLLVPTLIAATFKHPRPAVAHLRVIIPRARVAEQNKPLLMAKVVSSFNELVCPR
jgi:hypothetical protein